MLKEVLQRESVLGRECEQTDKIVLFFEQRQICKLETAIFIQKWKLRQIHTAQRDIACERTP